MVYDPTTDGSQISFEIDFENEACATSRLNSACSLVIPHTCGIETSSEDKVDAEHSFEA
jgi:hypothetical protein